MLLLMLTATIMKKIIHRLKKNFKIRLKAMIRKEKTSQKMTKKMITILMTQMVNNCGESSTKA